MAHFPQLSYANLKPWIPLESLGICHGQPCSIPRGRWRTRLLSWFLPPPLGILIITVWSIWTLTNLEILKQIDPLKWVHPRDSTHWFNPFFSWNLSPSVFHLLVLVTLVWQVCGNVAHQLWKVGEGGDLLQGDHQLWWENRDQQR